MSQLTLDLMPAQTIEQAINLLKKQVFIRNSQTSVHVYDHVNESCKELAFKAIEMGASKQLVNSIIE